MNRFFPILFLLALTTTTLFSQKEANIWYFGHNAGLNFNTNPPTPLLDGELNTDEGCATISDHNGNLLFYTDGTFVWNKNHQQMPNGFGLLGHKSSTQSGVIVPKPGNPDIYYVFTVDFTAGTGGIAYSEVDMNLDGGLGDVNNVKNIQLITPACEKITAVLHANEQDIWVIGHAWDSYNYMAWLVTENGVSNTPVISAVGSYVGGNTFNAIGYLKASANGDRIAAAHWYGLKTVDIFDFDNSTGVLSNPIQLDNFTGNGCYGVEFAPSEPILYVSEREYGGYLYQYDLSSNDEATIQASQLTLATYSGRWGAIQLGPDGKMYVAKRQNALLGVINNPDELGLSCDYQDDAMYLGGPLSWIGLPSFIQSYFVVADFNYFGTCPTLPVEFTLGIADSALDSLIWNFGNPASGADNISYDLNPTHTFTNEGTYEVTLIVYSNGNSDTATQEVTVSFPDIDLGADITSCENEINTLDATTPGAQYLWSDGSTNPTLEVTAPGEYWVEILVDGCPGSDTIEVFHLALPNVDIEDDPSICEDQTQTFDATSPNVASYLWQDNSTLPTLTTVIPGNYSVTVTGVNGCTAEDQSTLTVNPLPVFSLGADTEVCEGENYLLDVTTGNNSTYYWQDGSTNPIFNVSQGGTYTVQVTTNGCTSEDEIEIVYVEPPQVDLGNDTLLCEGEEFILDVYWDEYTTYTWNNNSNLPTFLIDQPGTYSVQLENLCGVSFDEIVVGQDYPPVPISIGNDTTICIEDPYLIDATNDNTTHYLWHDGSTESTIQVVEAGFYAITWANNCGFVTESIEVDTRKCECPVIFPNVFSPDGNGINETFNTVSPCIFDNYNLKIFTRWGELVFETNDPSMDGGWDGTMKGKDVSVGVYVYTVEFSHEFDKGRVSGDVTVIR